MKEPYFNISPFLYKEKNAFQNLKKALYNELWATINKHQKIPSTH